jgi:uncharacterized protein (TIGR00645 family)
MPYIGTGRISLFLWVWMGTVDFTALKLKLISSIVALSGISLLRSFLEIGDGLDEAALKWRVIIHLTFVVRAP